MFTRKQGSYTAVYALHVLLLSTCAARTAATPNQPASTPPAHSASTPPAHSASTPPAHGASVSSAQRAPEASAPQRTPLVEAPSPLPPAPSLPALPPERAPLERFRAALARTKQEQQKTRVLFFGDSHTAADFMSGRVRERLQAEYGDAGPGFIMTGRPWRSYRHARAELLEARGLKATYVRKRPESDSLALGLAGVAFTPASAATVEEGAPDAAPAAESPLVRLRITNASAPSGRRSHYELLFLPGAAPHVALDGQAPTPSQYAFDAPDDQPHDVTIASGLDVPLTLFGLVAELEGPGVALDTLGIPGARARAQLYWDAALLQEHIARRAPDLVVLSYGTNESTDVTQPIRDYESQLRAVVTRMRAMTPRASCLLVGPTDFPERVKKGVYQPRQRTAQINELQRKTAAEFGCAFFDVVEAMGGPLSMLSWAKADPPLGAKDLIHFTRRGYALLGDRIADLLLGIENSGPLSIAAAPSSPGKAAPKATARPRSKD